MRSGRVFGAGLVQSDVVRAGLVQSDVVRARHGRAGFSGSGLPTSELFSAEAGFQYKNVTECR